MSEDPKDTAEASIRFLEGLMGRSLNAIERLEIEKAHAKSADERAQMARELAALEELTMSPIEKRLRAIAFRKKLKARQGTIAPDFNTLYEKKAALDRKQTGHDGK
jgi:hypothetical protein